MACIIKRKYTYSVGYSTKNNNSESEIIWEVYYDYQQALERKKELDTQGIDKNYIDPEIKLYRYLVKYCNVYGLTNWSISTYKSMISITEHYLKPITHTIPVKDIDTKKAKKIYQRLESSQAVSSKKTNTKIPTGIFIKADSLLRSALDYANTQGLGTVNPFQEARKPIVNKRQPSNNKWTDEYLIAVLDNCDHYYLLLLLHLVFGCGLYVKEALAIRWKDVQLAEGKIYVNNEFNRYDTNVLSRLNAKEIVKVYEPTYSNSSSTRKAILKLQGKPHTVSIPVKIVNVFSMLKERYKRLKINNDTFVDDELLFCRDDGYPYEIRMIEKEFTNLKRKHKLPNLHLATLRTFGKENQKIEDIYIRIKEVNELPKRQGQKEGIYAVSLNRHIKYNDISIDFKDKKNIDMIKLEEKLKGSPELLHQLAKLLNAQ